MTSTSVLNGQVALVTGARRGIGRAIAIEFARQGADLVLNDNCPADELTRCLEEIRGLGRRAIGIVADVAQPDDVRRMFDDAISQLAVPTILVNNAGVESIMPLLELPVEEWERVTNVNLKGPFLCSQAAARHMADAGGGVIINIGSVQAALVLPGRTHYSPSKRAVEALTTSLAVELAEHRVRANCIHPGLIETPMTDWVMKDPDLLAAIVAKICAGRAGQPEEIARVAAFLASDDASYITGQALYVDGGLSIPR